MLIRYFAWMREKVGVGAEEVEVPASVATVADLMAFLAPRSAGHRAAFAAEGRVRCAVDQEFAAAGTSVVGAREIGFFPPVTGG
jgi:molybdopterin synthase sulfur carrier subunit